MFVSECVLNYRPLLAALTIGISAFTTGLSTPAFANSSDSADISAPLRAAQAAKQSTPANGDSEFRQLFTSWRSLDQGNTGATATGLGTTGFGSIVARSSAGSIPSMMPVQSPRFTSGFGMRWHPVLGGRRPHMGVDLADPVGTPVHATGDGMVGRADWFNGYGLYVQIEHSGQLETRYGHMSRLNVAAGQFVHRGDVIGYVGTTGRTTGPHLHYEVRVNGVAVNPIPYMQGAGSTELARAAAAAENGPAYATVTDTGDE